MGFYIFYFILSITYAYKRYIDSLSRIILVEIVIVSVRMELDNDKLESSL